MSASASSQTSAGVAELIANNLYDTRIVPQLEDYVLQQVRTSTYDFPPNRHLLSLYLSSPDLIRHDILRHLLFLSLAAYPANHFLSLAYLIPLPLQQQQPFSLPFRLHHLLSACLYPRFWAELKAEGPTAGLVSGGWEERIRLGIGETVGKMYTRVSIYTLQEYWNYGDKKQTEERCHRLGWQLEDEGKMVRVSAVKQAGGDGGEVPADSERKSRKGEVLSEEQLAKLLSLVQGA